MWLMRRVSIRVFQGILNSDFVIPCVLTDNVGLRYGLHVKDQAWEMLMGTLTTKNCSLKRIESALLGIEGFLRDEFRALGGTVVLAQ